MKIKNEFLKKYFFHILLWIVFTFSLAVDESELFLISSFIFWAYLITKTLILMVLVYGNLLYFYPHYFLKKKYFIYSFNIIALIIFIGFINSKLELFIREIRGMDNTELAFSYFIRQTVMAIRYVLTTFLLKATVDFYEQKEQIKKIESEKNLAELNFLKAQVNPHFLFNTLNNLYALILEKSDKSAECVLKLADILKYIIGEGTQDKVSLKKELLLLENYIELEKIRKPDAEVIFKANVNDNNLQITPLLLLPFVENAFKHGLNTVSKDGFIHLDISTDKQKLELNIENNLPPMGNSLAVESHGIGVENVQKRLELLYPGQYELWIERKEKSFQVKLNLQLQ